MPEAQPACGSACVDIFSEVGLQSNSFSDSAAAAKTDWPVLPQCRLSGHLDQDGGLHLLDAQA